MLDVEDHSGVTVLRLTHGKVNALDLGLLRAITAAVRKARPEAAVVITGAGSAFSAGRHRDHAARRRAGRGHPGADCRAA
jgi:enoyl-CoA hydratase